GQHDAQLLARLAAREDDALREVVASHASKVHRVAWRMLGEAQEAEDLTQEAILRLWDHAPRLHAKGGAFRMEAWLVRVATNLAFDRLRTLKRVSGDEPPDRADEGPIADVSIEKEQERSAARALVEALPERQRAAIVLTYYEELANAEAAAVLEMKLKAFESLLHRARAALRKAFEERDQGKGA
ncbi:MAG: sigma-70 family RNA polymerase sigma factor, partial [Pseudomonadota bacterium]